jgi:predicted dehydrogenase
MNKVRLGIIGVGGMGGNHARNVIQGKVNGAELTAVADVAPDVAKKFPDQKAFSSGEDLIKSGLVDAILIATPHYSHTPLGIAALSNNVHVLVEKPISVHKADCEKLIAAHKDKKLIFAAMFNQRTDPLFKKLKYLITSGELGEVRRINWIVTNWFRPHSYYGSGSWRATWAGEGGGVLLNQCPHNLDLWQWLFGMPKSIRAFCSYGRFHPIEVEDDATAYLEYANGTTGVLTTSTGEAPGTNRLEVAGERGKIVVEHGKFHFTRNEIPTSEFSKTTKEAFSAPPNWEVNIPIHGGGGQHIEIIQNFIEAIQKGTPLIAPAEEGINSVELANAMLLSSDTKETVQLPMNSATYEAWLKKKIEQSPKKK